MDLDLGGFSFGKAGPFQATNVNKRKDTPPIPSEQRSHVLTVNVQETSGFAKRSQSWAVGTQNLPTRVSGCKD